MQEYVTEHPPPQVVIACRVMARELEAAAHGMEVELVFLDQGLHRTPDRMPDLIQAAVDAAGTKVVGLGYGLCSTGLAGVKAGPGGLIVPRAHDCMALFMGSPLIYNRRHEARPGTYYLTAGWVDAKKDPLTIMREEYGSRLDPDTAEWVMREEIKHYTHICFLNTGVGDTDLVRRRTRKNAQYFGKAFEEIRGSLEFFRTLLQGPYPDGDFIILSPCQEIAQGMYY